MDFNLVMICLVFVEFIYLIKVDYIIMLERDVKIVLRILFVVFMFDVLGIFDL